MIPVVPTTPFVVMMERPITMLANALKQILKFLIKDTVGEALKKVQDKNLMDREEAIGTLIKCLPYIMLPMPPIPTTTVFNNTIFTPEVTCKVQTNTVTGIIEIK